MICDRLKITQTEAFQYLELVFLSLRYPPLFHTPLFYIQISLSLSESRGASFILSSKYFCIAGLIVITAASDFLSSETSG